MHNIRIALTIYWAKMKEKGERTHVHGKQCGDCGKLGWGGEWMEVGEGKEGINGEGK